MMSQAQERGKDQFIGAGVHTFAAGRYVVPVAAVHYGAEVVPRFRLRGSLSSAISANLISGDALYVDTVSDTSSGYRGGPDILFAPYTPLIFVLHATAGGEYRTGDVVGLFVEIQPFVAFDDGYIVGGGHVLEGLRFQIGVNFHF